MHAQVLTAVCVLLATATGYTYYPETGSSYKFYKSSVSWYEANGTCAREGAHLVVINDAGEGDIVRSIMKNATGDYYPTWTGLRYIRLGGEMEWRTVNGEPLSAVFHEWRDQPGSNAQWACAVFGTYLKKLYDWRCHDTPYLICEISQQK